MKKPKIKARRGIKICPNCYGENGARQKVCKTCKHEFPPPQPKINFKTKRRAKTEKVDWRELKKGDKILVRGGSTLRGEENDYLIARKGIFIVDKVDSGGIHSYSKKGTGHSYINMTKTGINKFGFENKPHEVRRIIG